MSVTNFYRYSLLSVDDFVNNAEIIRKMRALYDNFEANSSIDESITEEEVFEEKEFISSLIQTSVMK